MEILKFEKRFGNLKSNFRIFQLEEREREREREREKETEMSDFARPPKKSPRAEKARVGRPMGVTLRSNEEK